MVAFTKQEAREWAQENFVGVNNVIIPTFTSDLRGLNEAAIRHDTRREMALGFAGALLVGETATTNDEYVQFTEWVADEARGGLRLIHHASFNTLDENVEMANRAAAAGSELVLLSYPPNFFPQSEREIFEYTKKFCDEMPLGVILFPVPLWGYERIHGACLSPDMVEELVDECPNIVGVKAEGAYPSIAGFAHLYHRVGDRIIVEMPVEHQAIPLMLFVRMQTMATSNAEYYGSSVPTMFALMQDGKDRRGDGTVSGGFIPPGRRTTESSATWAASTSPTGCCGSTKDGSTAFNGGPLRMPTPRIVEDQMAGLRRGLEKAGLEVAPGEDRDFFIGRNPA